MKFNCPSLDLISLFAEEEGFKLANMERIHSVLSESTGWEWLNPIRETERFKKLLNQIEKLVKQS